MIPKWRFLQLKTLQLLTQLLSVAMYYFNPMSQADQNSEILYANVKKKIAKVGEEITAFEEELKAYKEKVNASGLMVWE